MALKRGKKTSPLRIKNGQASPHMGDYNLKYYLGVLKNLKPRIYFQSQGLEGALGNWQK